MTKIACTLTTKAAAAQGMEWSDLGAHAVEVNRLDRGFRVEFPREHREWIRDLAQRESECCAFLAIAVTERAETVELVITSDEQGAEPVVDMLMRLVAP